MTWKSLCAGAIVVVVAVWGLTAAWIAVERRDDEEFFALRDEGGRLIRQFEALRPDHVSPGHWHAAIVTAHEVWGNPARRTLFFSRGMSTSRLKAAVADLRRLAADADASNSIERLEQFFDVLLRYWPGSADHIERMRGTYRTHLYPSHREFMALKDEGSRIIYHFHEHRPGHIPVYRWSRPVSDAYIAWNDLFDLPDRVDAATLDSTRSAIEELRRLDADANPENALERLEQVFDLLLRHRPEKERDIEAVRKRYRERLTPFDAAGEAPP